MEIESANGLRNSRILRSRPSWVSTLSEPKSTANKKQQPIKQISVVSIRKISVHSWNDDQPGCSGIDHASPQPEVKEMPPKDVQEMPNVKTDGPLESAWIDLIERVSVAGWREAFDEKITWIRGCYKTALLILSVICVYYISVSLSTYFRSGYNDQINDFAMNEFLPFPNVTICAQLYFNQTFIRQNLTIPTRTMEILRYHNVSMDDFYRQLTLFLSPIARPHTFSPMYLTLFSKITAANPQVEDYSSFSTDAWLRCESMLRRCWFEGEEFDCCSKAVTSFDEDGICFQLVMNRDSDNAFPDKQTFRQRTPGPNGGLDVEASVDTRDFPWLDDDAQNGFRVLVGHTSLVVAGSPVAAPHGATTFIPVVPEKLVLASNCAGRGRLRLPFRADAGHYYDPEGIMCTYHRLQDITQEYGACQVAMFLFRPNRTNVCSPLVVYGASTVLTVEDLQQYIKFMMGSSRTNDEVAKKLMSQLEATLRSVANSKTTCPKHCQRWTYSSSTSFFYLENDDNEKNKGRMYSKLRIYYATLDYRQHEEVKETTQYLAFCNFGNIAMLYWGMSIVSFVHVLYYVIRYLCVRWRHRRTQDVAMVHTS